MLTTINSELVTFKTALALHKAKRARKVARLAEYANWAKRLCSLPIDEHGHISGADFDRFMAERDAIDAKWAKR